MDREQHITQDAAEHYSVYLMARTAEQLGVAAGNHSGPIYEVFREYLTERGWTLDDFESKHYPKYKINADAQVPKFVQRLANFFPTRKFEFRIDEAEFRKQGLKADFTFSMDDERSPRYVSLKNYIGTGGIERPQVSSGTYLSFAAGFVFERNGVGTYNDPRITGGSFRGSDCAARNAILDFEGRPNLQAPLDVLDQLQQEMRVKMLAPEMEMYDEGRVKAVVADIYPRGQRAIMDVFDILGKDRVRAKFLERAGLDGTEDALFFDAKHFLDSITNKRYNNLRTAVNDPETTFVIAPVGQNLQFSFIQDGNTVLRVDVPLTINTNGAWHRPKQRYTGTQRKNDKGLVVDLLWGQRRPRKSREIATSTNTYVDLKGAGLFT